MGFVWSKPKPEVQVSSGRLRGRTQVTAAGTRYHAFLGVPYAKPPVGELRFKAPVPAEPWTGVRDASVEGAICTQPFMNITPADGYTLKQVCEMLRNMPALVRRAKGFGKQSEDCLFLNVFVPASAFPDGPTVPKQRPVMFWIHGGAFRYGDGNPDMMSPELFLDKNIVVVTINYRLGPFGFLALGTADVPGNAGLKDQVLALRWTRDNIKAFGGDPDAITVYGESAGAASAHLISLAPACRGLFRAVIASSGSALSQWTFNPDGLRVARGLARALGLQADSPQELAEALRGVSASKLNSVAYKMPVIADSLHEELMYSPVLEPALPGAFMTEDPRAMYRSGGPCWLGAAPVLAGVCSAEGVVWSLSVESATADATYKTLNERCFLPPTLRRALTDEQAQRCRQEVLDKYTAGKPFSLDNVDQFIELWGDIMFMNDVVSLCRLHAEAGGSPLYLYRFNFVGHLNCLSTVCKRRIGKNASRIAGAGHADDLWHLGNIRIFYVPPLDPESREMVCRRRMVQLWANFIETGNPTPEGSDTNLLPVQWQPCSRESTPYLNIDDRMELRTDKLFPKQDFWEGLYQTYLGKPMWAAV